MGRGEGNKKMQPETRMYHNDERQQARRARQAGRLARQKDEKAFNEINTALGKISNPSHQRYATQQIEKMIAARTSKDTKSSRKRYADAWADLVNKAAMNFSSEDYASLWQVLPKIDAWQKAYARRQRHE